jgi:hypothetical protein
VQDQCWGGSTSFKLVVTEHAMRYASIWNSKLYNRNKWNVDTGLWAGIQMTTFWMASSTFTMKDKAWQNPSPMKLMIILVYDVRGDHVCDPFRHGRTVNASHFCMITYVMQLWRGVHN